MAEVGAALRILQAERRWLSQALLAAEAEIDAGCGLVEESRLRQSVATLTRELAEVVAGLGVLRVAREQAREARR